MSTNLLSSCTCVFTTQMGLVKVVVTTPEGEEKAASCQHMVGTARYDYTCRNC